jgi:hypothetical protein
MRPIGLAVVLALSFLTPLTVKAQPAPNAPPADRADAALAFFDTAEKVSPSDLERYERITLFQGMTLYVARVPAIAFRTSEIMSVIVERGGSDYRAIIRIAPNAAQRLHRFTERNIGKLMDIRFDGEHLSTLLIVSPFPSGLVAFGVGNSEARINKVFAPLGPKLSWKREER